MHTNSSCDYQVTGVSNLPISHTIFNAHHVVVVRYFSAQSATLPLPKAILHVLKTSNKSAYIFYWSRCLSLLMQVIHFA